MCFSCWRAAISRVRIVNVIIAAFSLGLNCWNYHSVVFLVVYFTNRITLICNLRICTIEQKSWWTRNFKEDSFIDHVSFFPNALRCCNRCSICGVYDNIVKRIVTWLERDEMNLISVHFLTQTHYSAARMILRETACSCCCEWNDNSTCCDWNSRRINLKDPYACSLMCTWVFKICCFKSSKEL
jgi:hypothetical protein